MIVRLSLFVVLGLTASLIIQALYGNFSVAQLVVISLVFLSCLLLSVRLGEALRLRRFLPFAIFGISVAVSVWIARSVPLPMEGFYSEISRQLAGLSSGATAVNYIGAPALYSLAYRLLVDPILVIVVLNVFVLWLSLWYANLSISRFVPSLGRLPWLTSLVLLLPTSLLYAADIGKEVILAAGVLVTCVGVGNILFLGRKELFQSSVFILVATCAMGFVRPPQVLIVFLATICVGLAVWRRIANPLNRVLVAVGTVAVGSFAGYQLEGSIGGAAHIQDYVTSALSAQLPDSLGVALLWNSQSIGRMITPETTLEVFLFAPIRGVLYLVAPFGSASPWLMSDGLFPPAAAEYWASWVTGVILFALLPGLVIAAITSARKLPPLRVLVIPIAVTLLSLGIATVLIFPRYRYPVEFLISVTSIAGIASASRRLVLISYGTALGLMIVLVPLGLVVRSSI